MEVLLMATTLRERLANMSEEELSAAWRATAKGDAECRSAGLLDFADDREENLEMFLEQLPVLEQIFEEVVTSLP